MKWMQCNRSVIPTLYVSNQKCLQQSPHALPLQDHMQRIVRRNDIFLCWFIKDRMTFKFMKSLQVDAV